MVNIDMQPYFTTGPGAAFMRRLGIEILKEAVKLVGFDAFTHDYRRYPRHLVETITMTQRGMEIDVGSDQDYALWHHEGTEEHPIAPVRFPRLVLKYPGRRVWLRIGQIVEHPGTKPNPFLRNAMLNVFGRKGFQVLEV